VRVRSRRPGSLADALGGVAVEVVAEVDLAGLSPDDVVVEALWTGGAGGGRVLCALAADGAPTPSSRAFRGTITIPHEGPRTLAIRVRPRSAGAADASGLESLVVWG
jgi:hypothetical protein